MKYEKAYDRENRVNRVIGINFAFEESDEFIDEVIQEVFQMDTMQPSMMSAKGLYAYINCYDQYVLERMLVMPIGSSFKYKKNKITRCSEHTYNREFIG